MRIRPATRVWLSPLAAGALVLGAACGDDDTVDITGTTPPPEVETDDDADAETDMDPAPEPDAETDPAPDDEMEMGRSGY